MTNEPSNSRSAHTLVFLTIPSLSFHISHCLFLPVCQGSRKSHTIVGITEFVSHCLAGLRPRVDKAVLSPATPREKSFLHLQAPGGSSVLGLWANYPSLKVSAMVISAGIQAIGSDRLSATSSSVSPIAIRLRAQRGY